MKTKLQNEKSISVLEDVAISQTERLRLVKVGDEAFLKSSVKWQSPQLIKLESENRAIKLAEKQIESSQKTSKSTLIRSPFDLRTPKKPKIDTNTAANSQANAAQTETIFDAIKQARDKNPLLGLDK